MINFEEYNKNPDKLLHDSNIVYTTDDETTKKILNIATGKDLLNYVSSPSEDIDGNYLKKPLCVDTVSWLYDNKRFDLLTKEYAYDSLPYEIKELIEYADEYKNLIQVYKTLFVFNGLGIFYYDLDSRRFYAKVTSQADLNPNFVISKVKDDNLYIMHKEHIEYIVSTYANEDIYEEDLYLNTVIKSNRGGIILNPSGYSVKFYNIYGIGVSNLFSADTLEYHFTSESKDFTDYTFITDYYSDKQEILWGIPFDSYLGYRYTYNEDINYTTDYDTTLEVLRNHTVRDLLPYLTEKGIDTQSLLDEKGGKHTTHTSSTYKGYSNLKRFYDIKEVRIIPLYYNDKHIAYRFKTDKGTFDVPYNLAYSCGLRDYDASTKIVLKKDSNGVLVSKKELETGNYVEEIKSNVAECALLIDIYYKLRA